jgi:hypothetical protein
MAISRRELGYLVNNALNDASDEVLVAVAELVLARKVVRRGGRYSLSATAAVPDSAGKNTGAASGRPAKKRVAAVSEAGMRVLEAFRQEDKGSAPAALDSNTIRIRSKVRRVNLGRVIESLTNGGYLSYKSLHSGRLYALTPKGDEAIGHVGSAV